MFTSWVVGWNRSPWLWWARIMMHMTKMCNPRLSLDILTWEMRDNIDSSMHNCLWQPLYVPKNICCERTSREAPSHENYIYSLWYQTPFARGGPHVSGRRNICKWKKFTKEEPHVRPHPMSRWFFFHQQNQQLMGWGLSEAFLQQISFVYIDTSYLAHTLSFPAATTHLA